MDQKQEYSYGGDLLKEMKEQKKLAAAEDGIETKASITSKCGTFLTIMCC